MKIKAILKIHQVFFFILFSFHVVTLPTPTTLIDTADSSELERIDPAVFINRDRYPLLFFIINLSRFSHKRKNARFYPGIFAYWRFRRRTILAQAGQAKTTGRG
jgi:hypothetical protein